MAFTKYLTQALLFGPACDKWAFEKELIDSNGNLNALNTNNNLEELNGRSEPRSNLGLVIGQNIQQQSQSLEVLSQGPIPSPFTLSLLHTGTTIETASGEWRTILNTGTVKSIAISGGLSGLSFSGNPLTEIGTITTYGTLSTESGGTGTNTLNSLKEDLELDRVSNFRDTDKPITALENNALSLINADISGLKTNANSWFTIFTIKSFEKIIPVGYEGYVDTLKSPFISDSIWSQDTPSSEISISSLGDITLMVPSFTGAYFTTIATVTSGDVSVDIPVVISTL